MADQAPRCAVIIPTYNGAALTGACLDSLLTSPPASCQWTIVVVDDGSTDGTAAELARFGSDIRLVTQAKNGGFARACNAGAAAAGECDYLVFLNNDTIPTAGWLDALIADALEHPEAAAVGARLLFPDGRVQHAGVVIGQDRWPHHLYAGFGGEHPAVMRSREVSAATAACLLVDRRDFDELGGFDTAYHNGYEDIDLCLRLGQRGRRIRYCSSSVVYHLESITRWPAGVPQDTAVSARIYAERWVPNVTPDDVQHYLDDGLLDVKYGAYFPVTLSVSPELAVVRSSDEELAGLERLLAQRSEQVMELLSIETRKELKRRGQTGPPPLSAGRGADTAEQVMRGQEHRLGSPGTTQLISLLLPVKNGAGYLKELLPAVMRQSISARLEIVAVDSGSEDDTIEVLKRFGATVLSIEPADFDHGLTRNLAAEHARGDVMVFMSQRALPANDDWLQPLIAGLDADPVIAGVCSRVLPAPDADVLARRDGERELSASDRRQRKQIDDWSAYRLMSAHDQRELLNFHTVSAAIRAEAWRRTPFQSVRTLGEDLLWAREVLESGWALVYEPASVVYHRHSYTLAELFARNVDDGIANRDIVDRSFESEQILPMLRAMISDDWSYLRQAAGLTGDDLEHWQLEAALRRVAQLAGQWVGANYAELPDGTAVHFSGVAQARARSRRNHGGER
jgi:GT2 family glycosyltransferase